MEFVKGTTYRVSTPVTGGMYGPYTFRGYVHDERYDRRSYSLLFQGNGDRKYVTLTTGAAEDIFAVPTTPEPAIGQVWALNDGDFNARITDTTAERVVYSDDDRPKLPGYPESARKRDDFKKRFRYVSG